MPSLIIHLFGPLRILLAGEPLPRVRSRSVEWLLALLALRQGRALDRVWLAGTLWPESEESQARHNLRNALLLLRKALGREGARIQSPTRDTLRLDLQGAQVDVVRFEAALQRGDAASLREAVALYTGPLLEGCFETWILQERESREQACLRALEQLAEHAGERGEPAEAIGYLRQALALDPLRDSIVRGLMASLAAMGDVGAAVEVYREFRTRLHEELAAAPDAQTVGLFQEIRERARQSRGVPAMRSGGEEPASTDKEGQTREANRSEGCESARPQEAPSPTQPLAPAIEVPRAAAHRPPFPLAPLIGREAEVNEVQDRLRQSRLLTLTGAGGVGKTRLALEVAASVAEAFEAGVVWVELAALSEGALILPTLAGALGLRQEGISEPQTLRNAVVVRLCEGACLLVLDNCEHLLDAVAEVAQTLLARCSSLRVLATSRQRMGLAGEIAWRVPSLLAPAAEEAPADAQAALRFPAIRLFVERAASALPGFELTRRDEVEAVCAICRRLDGIPLALELAAARTNVLSVGQIAARLDDRFRLLTGGGRTVSPRHQTLRALIDWSYEQLAAGERMLLRRLSVFAGGWSLEAAEALSADLRWSSSAAPGLIETRNSKLENPEVLDLLASLLERSLVQAEAHGGDLRYQMLETVREYAREKLQESGEEEAVRERHAEHYLALAEQAWPFLEKPELTWLDRLESEHDNLRAAMTFFAAQQEHIEQTVRLASALAPFWSTRGHFYEHRTWLLNLAARPTAPTKARSELLGNAARLLVYHNDFAGAKQMLSERLEIARRLGDRREITRALHGLAGLISDPHLAGPETDYVAARALAEESLAIVQELGDRQGMAHTLVRLGHLARQRGDKDEARARWLECEALDQELGNKGGYVLWVLGELALESGDSSGAHHFFGRYLSERYEIGDRFNVAWSLEWFASLALRQGEPERAARLLGASLALYESVDAPLSEEEHARCGALRTALREALGSAAFAVAWEAGRAMTIEEAVRLALSEGRT